MAQSGLRKFYRTFGSLKLAVITLSALAGTLIFSTFYESKTSTREVQALVYQSWWFITMLITLGVNVFCAAMVRYPWKGYQTGFVVTHLGIIILLVGSIIGLLFGVEGSITMVENGRPVNHIAQDFEVVQVTRKDTQQSINVPLQLENRSLKPGEVRQLKSGKAGLAMEVKAHHANTAEQLIVKEGGTNYNPAVKFNFTSKLPGMEQSGMNVDEWLVEGDPDRHTISVGPAVFQIASVKSEQELKQRLTPPEAPSSAAVKGKGVIHLHVNEKEYDVPVEEHLANEFKSEDGKVEIKLQKYFPDLRIVEKEPVSVSEEPNNPAVFYDLTVDGHLFRGFVFADYPEMNMVHSEQKDIKVEASYSFPGRTKTGETKSGALNTITLLVGPEHKLYYTAESKKYGFNSGELKIGQSQPVSPNSPIKPELTVREFISNPIITTKLVPAPTNNMSQFIFPAVEVAVGTGKEKQDLFLRWGEPKTVSLNGTEYELVYGWSMVPLDFGVQLEKFDAPKYEGTDMDAGYESYVKIKNAKNGEEFSHKIWMNHPLTYQGYRISQASFDRPQSAEGAYRSTLQVLKDPGWSLKLIGSLLIVLGIIIMFYIKPYFKGLQQERARRAAAGARSSSPKAPELAMKKTQQA